MHLTDHREIKLIPAKPAACGRRSRTALAVRSRKGPAKPAFKQVWGVPKNVDDDDYYKKDQGICGRSISFLVIFESNVSFETVFGGLWEHSRISDSWKHSLYSERLIYVIQLNNSALLTKQKHAFDETEASFWVTTHFGNHLHLFSEPTYPPFNS